MTRPVATTLLALLTLAGCGSDNGERNYNLIYSDIKPIEYARIQCRLVDMEDRHTCLTGALQHYRAVSRDPIPRDQVTQGPMIAVLREELYRGSYVSYPFSAAFTLSNGRNVCRGRFNAFAGDKMSIYRVRCDDGSTGTANLVLDASGANGLGLAEMDDGARVDIIFGPAAVADIVY
jgi:hypothetical protein